MLTWSDLYLVGIKSIDAEHQQLFELFNLLVETCGDSRSGEAVEKALDSYIKAMTKHFAVEEALLERHGYFGLQKQRNDHRHILERMQHIRYSLAAPGAVLTDSLLEEISSLKVNHIVGADQAYAEFLKEQGVR